MSRDDDNNMQVTNPFGDASRDAGQTAGAMQMQSRENSEVMAAVMSAKRFPRDMVRATDRIQNAFTRPTLAEKAEYQFARGGSNITGPSIRAAEAMSQQWGNMSNGWREINRYKGLDGVGVSEVEAYSVDFESNSREAIQFFVRHWRDTKSGGYALRDERDIYELCANQAQRRKRACILAQIPGDVIEMAMEQVAVTLKATADTSPEGIKKLEDAFGEFGVTKAHIEARIQRRLDAITPAQVVTLKRIYASLRDDMSNPPDWFDIAPDTVSVSGLEAVRAAAKAKRTGAAGAPTQGAPASEGAGRKPRGRAAQGAALVSEGTGAAGGDAEAATASSNEGLFGPSTYAQFADQINNASSAETATLALDEARTKLTGEHADEDLAALADVWRRKWQPGM